MEANPAVVKKWVSSAPFWEKHCDIICRMFSPVSKSLAEHAQITSGTSVLDVATGPGEPALSLAVIVGPQGSVRGVDPIPGMVEAAQREASRRDLTNAKFDVASATSLPYPDATFDAAVSRFGVMFFEPPVAGVREMLRVLKPGGRLALAVWCSAERNPFHGVLSRVIKKHVEQPPPEPDAPDAFRFAAEGKLRDVLAAAGAVNPVEHLFRFRIEAPLPVSGFLQLRLEMSEKLRETFAAFSQPQQEEVRREMLDALAEYETPGGMSFPTEVLIVAATSS